MSELTWQSEKPDREGWWWHRFEADVAQIKYIRPLRSYGNRLCVLSNGYTTPVEEISDTARWAGPIPLPQEP